MTENIDYLYGKTDIALLEVGGREAMACFIKLCRKVFVASGDRGLLSFVKDILPLLPEETRAEIIVLLFTTLVGERQAHRNDVPPPTAKVH